MKKLEVVTETVTVDAVDKLLQKVDAGNVPEPGLARARHLFEKREYVGGVIVEGDENSLRTLRHGENLPERARWVTEDLGDGRVVVGVCACGSANGCRPSTFEIRKVVRQ